MLNALRVLDFAAALICGENPCVVLLARGVALSFMLAVTIFSCQ